MSIGFVLGFIAAVIADQLVDAGVRTLEAPRDLLGNTLRLAPSTNDGIAFGLLQGTGPLPIVLSLGVMVGITIYARRHRADPLLSAGLGLLVGGAFANLLERLTRGAVLDYVDMGLGNLRWPTFNVGDIAISIAIVILVTVSAWRDRPTRQSSA
ncbi:MAG TPA: signal peptidase II [Patescibacteria group bacterium]|nr:signal peptidase II [Patescibacteria group bacterium]